MIEFGLFLIWSGIMLAIGSYFGRRELLRELGLSWKDIPRGRVVRSKG